MKHKHLKAVPQAPSIDEDVTPEEYAVITREQKIVGLANFHAAKEIAQKINGRVWATVTKDGKVEFLYPV